MEEKLSGIVLGGVNVGENDKILNVFTLEQGVVSAKIKGVKKAGAKLKFASEPFCFAQFVFAKTGKNRTVIGASLLDSFYPIREDLSKFFCGGALLEYVRKFLKEGIVGEQTFYLLVNTLKEMAYGEKAPECLLAYFLINALSLSGYALLLDGCFGCGCELGNRIFFDYAFGGFFCESCRIETSREINADTFFCLQKISRGESLEKERCIRPLKLLDFYLSEKADVKINSLRELLNIL